MHDTADYMQQMWHERVAEMEAWQQDSQWISVILQIHYVNPWMSVMATSPEEFCSQVWFSKIQSLRTIMTKGHEKMCKSLTVS